MKIAKIKNTDIANGPGIRVSIFVSGCRHACKGCFNRDIWDFSRGKDFNEEHINEIVNLVNKGYIKGVTFLGGEPLEPANQEGILEIINSILERCPNKTIWLYTGFVYEYLMDVMKPCCKNLSEILQKIDVLVDGKFEIDLLDLKLKFRGSKNQRVIDMKKTTRDNIIWALPFQDGEEKYFELPKERWISKKFDEIIQREIK